jgi:hypothetical protein
LGEEYRSRSYTFLNFSLDADEGGWKELVWRCREEKNTNALKEN